jgi:hypothetical protein
VAAFLHSLAASPRVAASRRVLVELAPIWWVVRAYVVAGALALAGVGSWSTMHPQMPTFGATASSLVVLGALLVGSVWLGLRMRRDRPGDRGTGAYLALNVVLVLLLVPVLAYAAGRNAPTRDFYFEGSGLVPPTPGLAMDGTPVANVYPYSRDGRPLFDVLLYDQTGRPLNIGSTAVEDTNRRVLVTKRGSRIFNSFPIRYFEPGTRKVARPDAAPRTRAPHVLTPALKQRRR